MITRKFIINVNNDRASSTQSIVLYKGDYGLLLNLELRNFKFDIDVIARIDATISNGKTIENLPINGNFIVLTVDKDNLNLTEAETRHIQLHLFDEYGNRISAPSFDIEVRDTIY